MHGDEGDLHPIRHEDRDRFDRLIDAALTTYAQPSAFSEPSIAWLLAQARSQQGRTRHPLWRFALPAAVCALALVIAGVLWTRQQQPVPRIAWLPSPPGIAITAASPHMPEAATVVVVRRQPPTQNVAAAREPLPKLDVFPTPRPLSSEEQTLVAFAAQAPPAAKHAVIDAQKHFSDPLVIAELKIRPLDEGEKQKSGKERELP